MKVSFFEKWPCYGFDYSDREDCLWIAELSQEQINEILEWKWYNLINIQQDKTCEIEIFETPEYLAKLQKIQEEKVINEALQIQSQKEQIIRQIWELVNKKVWMLELWLDITSLNEEIENLKTLYNNL